MKPGRFFTIVDANYNRAREGLRVAEDIERFYYRSDRFRPIRRLRHRLAALFAGDYEKLVSSRSVPEDRGAAVKEGSRKNMKSVLRANFSRAAEALRVLEEVTKTENASKAASVKRLRFRLYEIEKDFLKLQNK